MNERRRDKRVAVDLPITVKVGKRPLSGVTLNVSFHGLSVKLDETPPLRQLVHIDLNLPPGKQFTAHAMVVHGADGLLGLEFFGRSSHPEWDEFVQTQLRAAPLTNPNAAAVTTNPRVSVPPPLPPPLPPRNPATTGGAPPPPAPPPNPGPSAPGPTVPGAPPPPIPGTSSSGVMAAVTPPTAPMAVPPILSGSLPPAAQPVAQAPSVAPPPPPPMPHHPTPPPYAGQERRRAPRVHMQLELRLRTRRSIHTAHTVDVSMLGATIIVADHQAQLGETVIVNLIQPGTSFSFRRDGVVKRISVVEGPWSHVGVEFAMLEPVREVLFAEFMNTAYATLKGPPAG